MSEHDSEYEGEYEVELAADEAVRRLGDALLPLFSLEFVRLTRVRRAEPARLQAISQPARQPHSRRRRCGRRGRGA